jgi:hypothetical protein
MERTMDVIFVTLPKYLIPISILIRKLGYPVYYLKLSGNSDIKTENILVEKLKHARILPLPLEDITHFKGYSEIFSDPEMKIYKKVQDVASIELLKEYEKLFPNTTNITKKLQKVVYSMVEIQMMCVTGKVNIWANAYADRNHVLIDISPLSLIAPELAPNVRLLIIPLEIFTEGLNKIINLIRMSLRIFPATIRFKGKASCKTNTHSEKVEPSRVAFVTHQGLNYANLFQKDLFNSPQINSTLHPEKLLHFDYSGYASPSEKLKWVCLGNHRQSWISNISFAFDAMSMGILHIRRLRHILCLIIVTRSYVIFRSFSTKLEDYPDLKLALIDFELLCPRELLLALESKGIQTVATQERVIMAFTNYFPIILKHYLCASQLAADALERSPLNCIDHYQVVGQYRSDILFKVKKSPPPEILKIPLAKGLRVITALGFHTYLEWHNSQTEPLLNWKAHQHFLDDMIRLSCEIPDIFIILRYKDIEWLSLPIFAETIQKIKSSENIKISIDYDKSFVSYDLCAHSDLVIAKYTSLADECLSVGIPVLFHEYTHNTERIVADTFDYHPTKIMCFNYAELLERTKIILSGTPNTMTEDYEYLKNVVFGGMGDGKVKERIHAYIEEKLSEL